MGPDKDYCVPIGAIYRHLAVLACLVGLTIEIFANTLFLWPIDHSCARPENLTRYSMFFIDSHYEPIDLDAVQRNLLDATPEDSFTLARAKSMGVDYDDIARCYEYPVIKSRGNDSINMESIEPCSHGLHFEGRAEPHVSIVDRFELACSRQWLKVLLPQATVLGILVGLIMLYSFWLRSHRHRDLVMWTSINLALWLIVVLITLLLDSGGSENLDRRHIQYNWFLISLFLRSLVISSILWRMLIIWRSEHPKHSPHYGDSIKENHMYLVSFALIIITAKILYMPIILRLFSSWSQLNGFLNWNLLYFIALACLVELVHEPERFHMCLRAARERHARDETVAEQIMVIATHDDVDIVEDVAGQETTYANDSGASANKLKICEFCSAQEEMMFGSATGGLDIVLTEMQQGHTTRQQKGVKEDESPADQCADVVDDLTAADGDPYRPTTIPIEYAPDLNIRQPSTRGGYSRTKEPAATSSGLDHVDDSSRVTKKRVTMVRNMTATNQIVNYNKHPARTHNTSLLEMNLTRWPLISKLSILIYCLAFNYFLMQTMPNHRLMHAETISSLMARKTSHRHDTMAQRNKTMGAYYLVEPPVTTHQLGASGKPEIKDAAQEPVHAAHVANTTSLSAQESNSSASADKPVASPAVVPTVIPMIALNETRAPATQQQLSDTKRINSTSSTTPPQAQQPSGRAPESHGDIHHVGDPIGPVNATTNETVGTFAWAKSMAWHASLFNYKSVDYATETMSSLTRSPNPLEIGWVTMNLNGWPVEALVLLLFYSRWTNFAETYFKLNRLFSLVKHGSRLLLGEWLLMAVVPKQNHLLELDWLLALALTVARFASTLMLYSHLDMLFKLSAKMSSHRLVDAKRIIPIVLLALLVALMAPLFERVSLALIPLAMILSNLIIYYLSGSASEKFKALLCPMMFD